MRVDSDGGKLPMDGIPKPSRLPQADIEPERDAPVWVGTAQTYPPMPGSPPPGYSRSTPSPQNHDPELSLPIGRDPTDNPRPRGWASILCYRVSPRSWVIFIASFLAALVISHLSHSWALGRVVYAHESRWLQEQRKVWQQERAEEERHRKLVKMQRKGVYWAEPEGSTRCVAYGTRRYNAILKDIPAKLNWLEVCSDMPVAIHKRWLDKPNKCERQDDGTVVGTWFVDFDEPACVPYWGGLVDKGCATGKSGMRRLQARLWGIRTGDDWESMCATTPAFFKDASFEHPTACENKGNILGGIFGSWDYPDETC